jgi:hypothetical protein
MFPFSFRVLVTLISVYTFSVCYFCGFVTFDLNIFLHLIKKKKYARVVSRSCWAILKSSVKFFLAGILVIKHATSLEYMSLNPLIKFGSKLLCQAHINPLKVVGSILHIES